jgi:hypothetical protein
MPTDKVVDAVFPATSAATMVKSSARSAFESTGWAHRPSGAIAASELWPRALSVTCATPDPPSPLVPAIFASAPVDTSIVSPS